MFTFLVGKQLNYLSRLSHEPVLQLIDVPGNCGDGNHREKGGSVAHFLNVFALKLSRNSCRVLLIQHIYIFSC